MVTAPLVVLAVRLDKPRVNNYLNEIMDMAGRAYYGCLTA
jgi:hypothetical protein